MKNNLFTNIPATLPVELAETLARSEHIRIERIVSHGQASPPGFWYDQEWHEFVLLVSGSARLEFANGEQYVEMAPGDWLDIKAHARHRVDWTDPESETVWMAVHYR